ncbi:MAG: TAXI family TRAP transporter solute-binding subunit [Nautiliaceae bacterium]
MGIILIRFSGDNINKILNKEIDFGIAQSDLVYRKKGIKVVMALHSELLALVVRKGSGIRSFYQILHRKINIGKSNSGTYKAVVTLLSHSKRVKLGYFIHYNFDVSKAPFYLHKKKIDGYFYMVGHPAKNIKEAANLDSIDLISFYKVKAARELVKKYPYYAWGVIPSGTYKGVNHPTITYGLKALLITTSNMSEEVVYKLTKAILDNFDEFKKSLPQFKNLTKRDLLKGFDLKMLHPGAKRAFIEDGIL